MIESFKKADATIEFPEIVHALSFADFEWGSNLIAIGGNLYVSVGVCKFKDDGEGLSYEELLQMQHGTRVTSISWSMETSLDILPKIVKFATGAADNKLRIFTSDLKDQNSRKELVGHTGYINAIAFDKNKGDHCASVSDDQSCRIWSSQEGELARFWLASPGMAVCWHPDEPSKILVGLKNGTIRIYSLQNNQPIMSFNAGHSPLLSVDWSIEDCLLVVAVTATQCFLFDTSRSSLPINSLQSPNDGFREVKWCHGRANVIATTGRPGQPIKVFNLTHGHVILAGSTKISNGISWHHSLPVVAIGGDKVVNFWTINTT